MNFEVKFSMQPVAGRLLFMLGILLWLPIRAAAQSSYSLAQHQTTPIARSQTSRDTCWALAGVAALEAAHNRKYGMNAPLSEQYTFHMPKAIELQPRTPENNGQCAEIRRNYRAPRNLCCHGELQ